MSVIKFHQLSHFIEISWIMEVNIIASTHFNVCLAPLEYMILVCLCGKSAISMINLSMLNFKMNLTTSHLTSNQVGLPAELKHINKQRKRN